MVYLHEHKILSAPVLDASVPMDRPVQERCLGIVDVIDCKMAAMCTDSAIPHPYTYTIFFLLFLLISTA